MPVIVMIMATPSVPQLVAGISLATAQPSNADHDQYCDDLHAASLVRSASV
jgi:hypothetical protein